MIIVENESEILNRAQRYELGNGSAPFAKLSFGVPSCVHLGGSCFLISKFVSWLCKATDVSSTAHQNDFRIPMAKTKRALTKIPKSDFLFGKIKTQIEQSRGQVALVVNQALTNLYWNIGGLIHHHIVEGNRAEYGKEILATVSQQLTLEYGQGYNYSALTRMMKFYEFFPDKKILATLSQELSWSHFIELITVEDEIPRMFYVQMAIAERWSVRLLRERIDSMLFERTALSRKPEKLIRQELKKVLNHATSNPDLVFREPYFLHFLGLEETYSEKDLEEAILAQLQKFIVELGSDFAFLARQKRIIIDGENYKIDLLFYHRGLKCLVAIDLKMGKFRASDKGQMELYLRWLEKHEQREGENAPVGLILCSHKSDEHVELLLLKEDRIKVASYYTQLPSMELLKKKLHKAILIARHKEETKIRKSNKKSRLSKLLGPYSPRGHSAMP
jgi:predicted nuclease of restriction endonuclease-like (RecB) superfamily